jgi:hypothetical protein
LSCRSFIFVVDASYDPQQVGVSLKS